MVDITARIRPRRCKSSPPSSSLRRGTCRQAQLIALNRSTSPCRLAAGLAQSWSGGASRCFDFRRYGRGHRQSLDAVLEHLPAHTVTETPDSADDAGEPGEWSPLG